MEKLTDYAKTSGGWLFFAEQFLPFDPLPIYL